MLKYSQMKTALSLVTLMLLSSVLPGCLETVSDVIEDDELTHPYAAPKEAMGMWWPTIDGVIEIPTVTPITEWSDSDMIDIKFTDETEVEHPATLRYKSVEEGMALAVEIDGVEETPQEIVVTFPDRTLTTEITTESDAFIPMFELDCTNVIFDCSAGESQKIIDINDLMSVELLGSLRLNKIASVHDLDNDNLVMEASAKRLFDDTTEVSYTITVVFAESTWTFEKTTNFDWVLPFLFPRSDISVTGIEVTQAIQTADMQIPLVEGKTSMARVYIDSGDLTTANVEVTLTYCILIFCVDELTKTHVAVQNPDRTDIDESANFILPDHWVTHEGIDGPIPIGLIASIKPVYPTGAIDYLDPDNSNNWVVQVFELNPTHDLKIVIVPFHDPTTSGTQQPFDTTKYWMDMLVSTYPIADVELLYFPFININSVGDDNPEIRQWLRDQDTAWTSLAMSAVGVPAWDQMHGINPIGSASIGGGLSDPMWGGGGRASRVSVCGPGATSAQLCTAHEINHNLGPQEWDADGDGFDSDGSDESWGEHLHKCGTSVGADSVWNNLYSSASTSANINDLGWDPLTLNPETNQNALIPSGYPDFMSYCMAGGWGNQANTNPPWNLPYMTNKTKWISTYRYQYLFDMLSDWDPVDPPYLDYYPGSTLGSPSSSSEGRQSPPPSSIRLIRGIVPHDGSTPVLQHSWMSEGILTGICAEPCWANTTNPDYSVIVKDGQGNILDSAHFIPNFMVHESLTNELQDYYFSFYFQDDGQIQSVELVDANDSLIDMVYSSSAPVIRMLPLGTTEYTREGPVNLSWTQASSTTNRETLYQLEYYCVPGGSYCGDGAWLPIGGMTNSTSTVLDFGTLPGGTNNSKFRVRATNGFDTYYAESTEFSLPNQAPALALETSGALGLQSRWSELHDTAITITQGESFSITPKITDADWTPLNENGFSAVLKRDGETVWAHGGDSNWRAPNRVVTLMHSIGAGCPTGPGSYCTIEAFTFPNADLLPGEMKLGAYEFEMTYEDEAGSSVTKTVSFSIIVPNYLVGPNSNAKTEDVLDEYRSNLQSSLIANHGRDSLQLDDDLSRDELQYYVELERAARGDDNALSDVEIDDLQAFYGISDSRAAELEVMICVPPKCKDMGELEG
jgi:hypothetical protein